MERKLKFLESEIKKDGIRTQDSGDSPDAPPPREMSDLESTFEKLEQELQEVITICFKHYFSNRSFDTLIETYILNWQFFDNLFLSMAEDHCNQTHVTRISAKIAY